jgi:hypothetical protein
MKNSLHFIVLCAVAGVALAGAVEQRKDPSQAGVRCDVQPRNVQPESGTTLRAADFGTIGDGVHDDGPAINAAFGAAKEDRGPSSVVVGLNLTYSMGESARFRDIRVASKQDAMRGVRTEEGWTASEAVKKRTLTKVMAVVLTISALLTSDVAAQGETNQDQPPNILFISKESSQN